MKTPRILPFIFMTLLVLTTPASALSDFSYLDFPGTEPRFVINYPNYDPNSTVIIPPTELWDRAVQPNNIFLNGTVCIDINVTLHNKAAWTKFIYANPYWDTTVIEREKTGDNTFRWQDYYFASAYSPFEGIPGSRVANNINLLKFHAIPDIDVLNYHEGFWIYPKETVTVRLHSCVPLQLYDYKVGEERYYFAVWENPITDTIQYGAVVVDESTNTTSTGTDGGMAAAGDPLQYELVKGLIEESAVPKLLTKPILFLDPEREFEERDKYIEVLKYDAEVVINIKDVGSTSPLFKEVFAISMPVVFEKGTYEYHYDPEAYPPTAMLSEYMTEILPKYTGMDVPEVEVEKPKVKTEVKSIFKPKTGLLFGKSVDGTISRKAKKAFESMNVDEWGKDFPVYVVWLQNEITLRYRVHWSEEDGDAVDFNLGLEDS